MKERLLAICFFCLSFNLLNAQQEPGLYVGINPFGVLEPQAAYGIGFGYRFNDYWELYTEYSVIRPSFIFGEGRYEDIIGFRSITQLKYTLSINEDSQSKLFVGAEYRHRSFIYQDVASFTNKTTGFIYKDVPYQNNTTVRGGALLIGKQWDLGSSSNWALEIIAGFGLRTKYVFRDGAPANSFVIPKDVAFGETPNYLDKHSSFYVPFGIRVMLKL